MSQNGNEVSVPEQDGQESDSVYDFLYHDVRRVGSFLSQFNDAGLLQQITQTEGAHKSTRRSWKTSAGGNLFGFGGANIGLERGPGQGGYEASDRVYDPLWTNALALLDFLETRELIVRDIGAARIGQFVLVTGRLAILDLKLFRGLWDMPAVRDAIKRGLPENQPPSNLQNRADRRRANSARPHAPEEKSQAEKAMDAGLSIVGMLPHVVQARMMPREGGAVWASLTEDGLVVSAADIVLKHGTAVAGEWSALGVLDAMPDADADGNMTDAGRDSTLAMLATADNPFSQLMFNAMPHLRPLLGRPFDAYGMTPLLIFREISG